MQINKKKLTRKDPVAPERAMGSMPAALQDECVLDADNIPPALLRAYIT